MKKIVLKSCIVILLTCTTASQARDINDFCYQPNLQASYPADISFCIVDLKYNDNNTGNERLKICEFGQGAISGFLGHQMLYGPGKIWGNLWQFIASFNKPILYVNPELKGPPVRNNHYNLGKLMTYPQHAIIQSPVDLITHRCWRTARNVPPCDNRLSSITAIMCSNSPKNIYNAATANTIATKCPGALFLDNATRGVVLNKARTHLLFANDPAVQAFRPAALLLKKKYTATLAQEIMRKIPATAYVIKPIDAWKGDGILMVRPSELDKYLHAMLNNPGAQGAPLAHAVKYWAHDHARYFLVERLESSQPIKVKNRMYDATMRVAVGLAYDNGDVRVEFLGAYWKLPDKAVNDNGTLTERFKSHISGSRTTCSASVNPITYIQVQKYLNQMLPHVYRKMVALRNDDTTSTLLNRELHGRNAITRELNQ